MFLKKSSKKINHYQLDIISFDPETRRQSDLLILKNELAKKKIKINVITEITDLDFSKPMFIHSFSGCLKKRLLFNKIMNLYLEYWAKFACHPKLEFIWKHTVPRIYLNLHSRSNDNTHSSLNILFRIRNHVPHTKLLYLSIINYALNKNDFKQLIVNHLHNKNVTKAIVRFPYANNVSFLINVNQPETLDINYRKYVGDTIHRQHVIIHPITSEINYLRGIVSLIYINGSYSHSILKTPHNLEAGQLKYNISKHSPEVYMKRYARSIVNYLGDYPVIQINLVNHKDTVNILTKVNYLDPKLYLEFSKSAVKKIKYRLEYDIRMFQLVNEVRNSKA